MEKLVLLLAILIFFSCQKEETMVQDFPVFPASTFLTAGEKVTFQYSSPGGQLINKVMLGSMINNQEYQAPDVIEKSQKEILTFKKGKDRTQVPIYLLDPGVAIFTYKNDWISVDLGDKVLESNVWGATQGDQKIDHLKLTQFQIEKDQYVAWKWQATNQRPHTVLAYPEMVFGWKPWRNASTTTALPKILGQIQAIPVSYEYQGAAKGSFNLAFDCWITESTAVSQENISTEVMIWEKWANINPVGQLKRRVKSPYGTYEFWEGVTTDGWKCLTFRRLPSPSKGNLDLQWFLSYLLENALIEKSQTLASVEFGNEIGNGSGLTVLKNYQISIESF